MGENVQTYLVVCRVETDKLVALLISPVIPSIELVYEYLVCLLDNNYICLRSAATKEQRPADPNPADLLCFDPRSWIFRLFFHLPGPVDI